MKVLSNWGKINGLVIVIANKKAFQLKNNRPLPQSLNRSGGSHVTYVCVLGRGIGVGGLK